MTDTVRVLSDDALREIEARALQVKELVGVGQFGEDMLALCATVRALRTSFDISEAARGHDSECYRELLRTKEAENTALREQLAQSADALRRQVDANIELQSQLAQREQEWKAFENLGKRVEKDLRAELAQVTQERLTEEERKVLTDHHYYESEKAITRYGDKVGQRLHLERLAIIRDGKGAVTIPTSDLGCQHCTCTCVNCAPCGVEEQP